MDNLRCVLRLEIIGDNYYAYQRAKKDGAYSKHAEKTGEILGQDKARPWVARLTGLDPEYGFNREFIRGQKDYSLANSVGSRGVYIYYPLVPGIYEVHERLSWKHTRRYFILVDGAVYTEITREAAEWLLSKVSE